MFKPVPVGDRTRYSYARINEILAMPHLIDIQRKSYEWFIQKGLMEILHDISPIKDFAGNLELYFESFELGAPKYSVEASKKAYRDIKNSIDTAKQEGLAEGLEIGMEKGMKQGMEKGMKQGMEKGMNLRSLEIARKMLAKGMDEASIMDMTGLTAEEIKLLKAEM